MKRVIVSVTGASGSVYAKTLVEELVKAGVETHLIATDNGKKVFKFELGLEFEDFLESLSGRRVVVHDNDNMFASVASGSFRTDGMIVLPASMSSVAKIANGISDTLMCRAADVVLKEKRRLVVCPRESPFSSVHLKNMLTLSETNAIILPLLPAFYTKPKTVDDIVMYSVSRILGFFGDGLGGCYEWSGMQKF